MIVLKYVIFFGGLIMSLFPQLFLFSQEITWQRTSGIYGGRIFEIACSPGDILFTGPENYGIFRSTDDGQTWHQTSFTEGTLKSITFDSYGNLYAGISSYGIFKSTDQGLTWSIKLSGDILSLTITPGNFLFAGTFHDGVFISTDHGETWQKKGLQFSTITPVYSIASDSLGNVFAGTSKGLFRSENSGETWEYLGFDPYSVQCITVRNNSEILISVYPYIYRSIDNGTSWKEVGNELPYVNSILVGKTDSIYAITDNGVYISKDSIENWTQISVCFPMQRFHGAAINSKGWIFLCNDRDGVARSTDNGSTWMEVNYGLTGNPVNSLKLSPAGHTYAGTARGIYCYQNDLESWSNVGLSDQRISSLAITPDNTIFAGTHDGIYSSSDNLNWTRVDNGFDNDRTFSLALDNFGKLYAGTVGQIYTSIDLGETWSHVYDAGRWVWAMVTSKQNYVYASVYRKGLFWSIDGGANWEPRNNGLSSDIIYSLLVSRNGYLFAGAANGSVFRSTDNGQTWQILTDSLSAVWSIIEDNNGNIYACCNMGVFYSEDLGETWTGINTGLSGKMPWSLSFNSEGNLLLGMKLGGVFKTTRFLQSEPPQTFELSQNYPNPFNLSTLIQYSVSYPMDISLKVYNLRGQYIATVASGFHNIGTYKAIWSPGLASNGRYFCIMKSSQSSEVRKMIFVK